MPYKTIKEAYFGSAFNTFGFVLLFQNRDDYDRNNESTIKALSSLLLLCQRPKKREEMGIFYYPEDEMSVSILAADLKKKKNQ